MSGLPSPSVILAALGACVVRRSRHSLSGWVAVARFPSTAAAGAFASAWAVRLPRACRGVVVRRARSGFVVSVPVAF